jgi:CRP/FNR family transcriptional regulator
MSINKIQPSILCQHCALMGMCFSHADRNKSEPKTRSHKVYQKSNVLFSTGQAFDAIYVLRSGSAKSTIVANSGQEQISSFYFPGDLIGLDGFDSGFHAQSIKFLETSSVCRIGLAELDNAMASSPNIRHNMLQSMSLALNKGDKFLLRLNHMNSAQRLGSFMLDLSSRFEQRGLSGNVFNLSMTRVDIANYLGMAIETVSRLLTQLHNERIIEVQKRRVSIVDRDKLSLCLLQDREPHVLFSEKSRQSNSIQVKVA